MPRRGLLLFLFVLLSLGLMTYQSSRRHSLTIGPLQAAYTGLSSAKNSVENFVASPFRKIFLQEQENRRLKEEVAHLRQESHAWREAFLENKRLKELLSLKEREHRYVTSASVVARSSDQWSNTVILDKGFSAGIRKDMIAVTPKGIAGKILEVSASNSSLLMPIDINFSAAARFQQSRAAGILSGTGFRDCRMKYISYEEEIAKGDIVITSGLDELFPPGIPLGYVSRVNKKTYGLFQEIEVRPFVDASKVETVAIVTR